jgi:hypothetical protein
MLPKNGHRLAIPVMLVVAAALAWWLVGFGPATATQVASGGGATTAPDEATEPSAPASREVGDAPSAVLEVHVHRRGQEVAGQATWLCSADLSEAMSSLVIAPLPGQRDDPRARTAAFRGPFEIVVPGQEHTWLRIVETAGAKTFRRIMPFAGRQTLSVDLGALPRALHVRVLQADLRTPVAGVAVFALRTDLETGQRTELGPWHTGPDGYVLVKPPDAGAYVLRADSVSFQERPPQTASVVLGGAGPQHVPVLLILPASRGEVVAIVHVDGLPSGLPATKLALRRLDAGGDEYVPQDSVLKTGIQELRFQVPEGDYQFAVMPQRALLIEGDTVAPVRAGVTVRRSLSLSLGRTRTRVRLLGVDRVHFPARVFLASGSGMRVDDPEHEFVGPFRWATPECEVASHPEPVVVAVLGGHQYFVTSRPVVLDGETVDIELVPATWLTVAWSGWEVADAGNALAIVAAGGLECARWDRGQS